MEQKFLRILGCSALLLVSSASASVGSSFYIGGEGSFGHLRIKPKSDTSNNLAVLGLGNEEAFSKNAARFGAFVGYGYTFSSNLYVALQLGGGLDLAEPEYNKTPAIELKEGSLKSDINLKFRSKYYYDGIVQIGYAFTPKFLVYGLVGAEGKVYKVSGELSSTLSVAATKEVPAAGQSIDISAFDVKMSQRINDKTNDGNKKTNVFYGVVGLGTRYFMTDHVFVGLEAKALLGCKKEWKISSSSIVKEVGAPSVIATGGAVAKSGQDYVDEKEKAFDGMQISGDKLNFKTNSQNYVASVSIGYKF